jgi:hypothetical protein
MNFVSAVNHMRKVLKTVIAASTIVGEVNNLNINLASRLDGKVKVPLHMMSENKSSTKADVLPLRIVLDLGVDPRLKTRSPLSPFYHKGLYFIVEGYLVNPPNSKAHPIPRADSRSMTSSDSDLQALGKTTSKLSSVRFDGIAGANVKLSPSQPSLSSTSASTSSMKTHRGVPVPAGYKHDNNNNNNNNDNNIRIRGNVGRRSVTSSNIYQII